MHDPSAFWDFDVMVLLKPKWNFNSPNDNASLVADPMAVQRNLHFSTPGQAVIGSCKDFAYRVRCYEITIQSQGYVLGPRTGSLT